MLLVAIACAGFQAGVTFVARQVQVGFPVRLDAERRVWRRKVDVLNAVASADTKWITKGKDRGIERDGFELLKLLLFIVVNDKPILKHRTHAEPALVPGQHALAASFIR